MYYKYCTILIALISLGWPLQTGIAQCHLHPPHPGPATSHTPALQHQPSHGAAPAAHPLQTQLSKPHWDLSRAAPTPTPTPTQGKEGKTFLTLGERGKTCSDSFLPSATIQFPSLTPNMVLISFISSQLCCKAAVSHGINLCFH